MREEQMYILGISCYYHDAAACLIKDGKIIAAAQEERFTRVKHDTAFPLNAIRYCLHAAGITMHAVEYCAFYEKPLLKFERILSQHLEMFPQSFSTFVKALPSWVNEKLRVPKKLRKIGYRGDVFFVEHHLAHAAAGFLASPFKKAAILTIDGVGEWATTTYGIGNGTAITLEKKIEFPHSIGLLYSAITAYLGFSVNNAEYKVMGLAAYGAMNKQENTYYARLRKVIDIKDDGSFFLDMSYFTYHYADRMPSKRLCALLGGRIRKPGDALTKRHQDIAAAVQLITEEVIMKMLTALARKSQCTAVVLSGGVALNSVANGKILQKTPFKRVWIPPNPGDGGAAIGAAYYLYSTILGQGRVAAMDSAFLGPEYTDAEIREFLDQNNIAYTQFRNTAELIAETASLIAKNNVVAWFQGRMEWGPRALGARSILANPCNPRMQQILNAKVKHRELFRPFAPVVCREDALTYFECDSPLPQPTDYMLMVYVVRKTFRKKLPAITHVDGTGRLQTIARSQHTRYYDLIKAFGKLSGISILINTSFNIRGEPIVCTPKDAYQCMMGTGIDYLVIGSYLVQRSSNLQDAWDSEQYARD